MVDSKRIEVLDFLRGIASLAVSVFHFANILGPGLLKSIASYGYLGVEVFFVISGFVIPYSLYRGGYKLPQYGKFVLKRIIRLDPPYIVTIILILGLGYLSLVLPYAKVGEFHASFTQVLLHLGYLNTFFQYEWLNDVFWTLAIEFQYYLLIGMVYPLLVSRNTALRLGTMALLGALAFVISSPIFVFYYIFLFLIGISTFQYRIGLIDKKQYAVLTLLFIGGCFLRTDVFITAAGTFAVLAILFLRIKNRVFDFLGKISYSLYLLHSPIGRRALNVGARLVRSDSEATKILLVIWAVGFSIFSAYLMYRFVERPSQELSSSLTYKGGRKRRAKIRESEMEQLDPAL
jgi:peptidoglycan/LPS O-acetylase OafA/YrhL